MTRPPRRLRAVLALAALAATGAGAAAAVPADAAVRPVDVRFSVRLLDGRGAVMRQSGTFAGAPFGRGRVDIRSEVGKGRGARVTFLLTTSAGKLRCRGDVKLTFSGSDVHYAGSAQVLAGTGRYRHAHSRALRLVGSGDLTGDRFGVVLSGRIAGV